MISSSQILSRMSASANSNVNLSEMAILSWAMDHYSEAWTYLKAQEQGPWYYYPWILVKFVSKIRYHLGFDCFWRNRHSILQNFGMEMGIDLKVNSDPFTRHSNETNLIFAFNYCIKSVVFFYARAYKSCTVSNPILRLICTSDSNLCRLILISVFNRWWPISNSARFLQCVRSIWGANSIMVTYSMALSSSATLSMLYSWVQPYSLIGILCSETKSAHWRLKKVLTDYAAWDGHCCLDRWIVSASLHHDINITWHRV